MCALEGAGRERTASKMIAVVLIEELGEDEKFSKVRSQE